MKAVIHSVYVSEHGNLRACQPDDPNDVDLWLRMTIGPKGPKRSDARSDCFTLRVATPTGLLRYPALDGVIASRAILIVDRYSFELVWSWLERTVAGCEGLSWTECLSRLRVHFDWEWEWMERRPSSGHDQQS